MTAFDIMALWAIYQTVQWWASNEHWGCWSSRWSAQPAATQSGFQITLWRPRGHRIGASIIRWALIARHGGVLTVDTWWWTSTISCGALMMLPVHSHPTLTFPTPISTACPWPIPVSGASLSKLRESNPGRKWPGTGGCFSWNTRTNRALVQCARTAAHITGTSG